MVLGVIAGQAVPLFTGALPEAEVRRAPRRAPAGRGGQRRHRSAAGSARRRDVADDQRRPRAGAGRRTRTRDAMDLLVRATWTEPRAAYQAMLANEPQRPRGRARAGPGRARPAGRGLDDAPCSPRRPRARTTSTHSVRPRTSRSRTATPTPRSRGWSRRCGGRPATIATPHGRTWSSCSPHSASADPRVGRGAHGSRERAVLTAALRRVGARCCAPQPSTLTGPDAGPATTARSRHSGVEERATRSRVRPCASCSSCSAASPRLLGAAASVLIGSDDTAQTGPHDVFTPGVAIVTDAEALHYVGPTLHLTVEREDGEPVFVGVANEVDVASYVGEQSRRVVSRVKLPWSPTATETGTGVEPLPAPGQQPWWIESVEGSGPQELVWPIPNGRYSIAVLNADGSPGRRRAGHARPRARGRVLHRARRDRVRARTGAARRLALDPRPPPARPRRRSPKTGAVPAVRRPVPAATQRTSDPTATAVESEPGTSRADARQTPDRRTTRCGPDAASPVRTTRPGSVRSPDRDHGAVCPVGVLGDRHREEHVRERSAPRDHRRPCRRRAGRDRRRRERGQRGARSSAPGDRRRRTAARHRRRRVRPRCDRRPGERRARCRRSTTPTRRSSSRGSSAIRSGSCRPSTIRPDAPLRLEVIGRDTASAPWTTSMSTDLLADVEFPELALDDAGYVVPVRRRRCGRTRSRTSPPRTPRRSRGGDDPTSDTASFVDDAWTTARLATDAQRGEAVAEAAQVAVGVRGHRRAADGAGDR